MQGLRLRLRAWFEARLPCADSVTLTQRSVYILPTRAGFMLGATLLVLLIASINYQLNLGYLLTFLLAGSSVVGMHVCHATLRGLTMKIIAPEACYAGATAVIGITLLSQRKSVRHAIGIALLGSQDWVWSDVPAWGSSTVHVSFKPPRRGLNRVPTLTAQTHYPLGTFRVWTVWRPAAQVMVYPAPEAHPPALPPGEPRCAGVAQTVTTSEGQEFDGVRPYRRGDPLKSIAWKKLAQTDTLVSRDSQQAQHYELWLDRQRCAGMDAEAQLSRLCAWVLQAEKRGLDYGLRLGGQEIPPGHGPAQQRRCLEALALC